MKKNKTLSLLIVLMLFFTPHLFAQVDLGGSLDLEFRSGGSDSKFITNEIAQDYRYPHLSIAQINAFLFAPIDRDFFFESRIQMDTWGTGELNQPRLTLAYLGWEPEGKNYSLQLGRFVNPFGFYPNRTLAFNNVFTAAPLAYGYFVNISDKRGYWPQAGDFGTYTRADVGQSTVYFGGYTTGLGGTIDLIPDKLTVDLAITNSAPSSPEDYTNLRNVAGIARVGFKPNISWDLGLSLSHGSFMQRDPVNSFIRTRQPLENFTQSLAGVDFVFQFLYFEIVGEAILSHWRVPRFQNGLFTVDNRGNPVQYNITNIGSYIDLKYEPPFLTGSYLAVRAENLSFIETDDPVTGETFSWDDDVTRLTFAAGYKISRTVLGKVSYSDQTPFNQSQSAFRVQITTLF